MSIKERINSMKNLKAEATFQILLKNTKEGLDCKTAKLLDEIRKCGSISLASKKIHMDYKIAWDKISKLEKTFGMKIVERTYGGLGGGSAKLTLEGEILLQKYFLLKKRFKTFDKEEILKASLKIYGSHCHALEFLIEMLEKKYKGFFIECVNVGSREGLNLVLEGIADISGIHLFDEKTGEYNMFLLKDENFKGKIAIIKGYKRIQGLIVKKNNPKKIFSIKDIFRKDVVFINRNKGSGTRLLIDHMINQYLSKNGKNFEKEVKKIRGYENEVRSHLEVGIAIKENKADCGLGIKSIAKILDLGFLPLKEESFDFVFLKKNIEKDNIKKFIKVLSSNEFKKRVLSESLGITFFDITGKVYF